MLSEKRSNAIIKSHCYFGSICCFLAGVVLTTISVFALFLPASIASYQATDQYFFDFLDHKETFILLKILLFIANLTMISVVSAFASLVREKNSGIVLWASSLAIIGYGFGMYQSILDITVIPKLVDAFVNHGPLIKETIKIFGFSNPAVYIVSMGLPGLWFIIVSLLAFDNDLIPKGLIFLGFLWGLGSILTAVAHTVVNLPLIYLVAVGAIIFAPIWSFWEGLFLLKIARKIEKK